MSESRCDRFLMSWVTERKEEEGSQVTGRRDGKRKRVTGRKDERFLEILYMLTIKNPRF